MVPYTNLIKEEAEPSILFSICSIVNKHDEYLVMKESFEARGFDDQCEYIIADNTKENQFHAYEAIGRFIRQSKGKYIILVHQDVRCIDHKKELLNCLDSLDQLDDKWAICGNAGGMGHHQTVLHIYNDNRNIKYTHLPAKVTSLDENFLVIKASTNMTVSPDLGGFHLYGTDLCIIADFLGYTCYVIPFLVQHLSVGNMKSLKKEVPEFVEKYGRKLRSRYIQTTCTNFYLGNSPSNNRFYNSPFIYFFIKAYQRMKFGIKLLRGKYPHKNSETGKR
jgi:hypothetical protein